MDKTIYWYEHKSKKKIKKTFWTRFLSWWITQFWKNYGKLKKTKITTERKRNYLVPEPNYHNTKFFTENLLTIEMKQTDLLMNKIVYLGLLILELSKILMYEFWYDYVKPKFGEKEKVSLYT